MEYTLEDTFTLLQERKAELEKNIEELINILSNNETFTLNASSSSEDVKMKQEELCQNLLEQIQQTEPKDDPILRTPDSRSEVMTEMEKDIHDMQQLLVSLQQKLSDIQEDIAYLKNKKNGLNKMQEAHSDATKILTSTTYQKEGVISKRIFREVKKDLLTVVDAIFPDNENFKMLLAALTSGYLKGGDDVYVDVTPDDLEFVYYLLEANIVQYHRNDRTKIRMTEML